MEKQKKVYGKKIFLQEINFIYYLNNKEIYLINKLYMTENDIDQCLICIEDMDNDEYKCQQCEKIYHHKCYKKWIKSGGNTCPNCRRRISDTKLPKTNSIGYRFLLFCGKIFAGIFILFIFVFLLALIITGFNNIKYINATIANNTIH